MTAPCTCQHPEPTNPVGHSALCAVWTRRYGWPQPDPQPVPPGFHEQLHATTAVEPAEPVVLDEEPACCVCGGGPVVYRNCLEQPFCVHCADCQCRQNPCIRTGVNDPAVSAAAAGYCPQCGRGDAGPTADEYEQQRQRAANAEAELHRVRTVLRLLPAPDASLRGQLGEAICTWADHTSSDPEAAVDAVLAVIIRYADLHPEEPTP
jgi:hypothetical protein